MLTDNSGCGVQSMYAKRFSDFRCVDIFLNSAQVSSAFVNHITKERKPKFQQGMEHGETISTTILRHFIKSFNFPA